MFTFSFGSAFAASYNSSDYATQLSNEMTNQLTYLANAKTQAVTSGFAYNNLGYTNADGSAPAADTITGYSKTALEAAADEVIGKLTTAMGLAISNATTFSGTVDQAADLDIVREAAIAISGDANNGTKVSDCVTADGLKAKLLLEVDVLNKTQAPITKSDIEAKITAAVNANTYSTEGKNYPKADIANGPKAETLTAAEYVAYLADTASESIRNAASADTDAATKITAYETAYTTFTTALKAVPTSEDENISDSEATKDVAGAVNDYLQYGISQVYNKYKLTDSDGDGVYTVPGTLKAYTVYEAFYEPATSSAKAKLFGVEIADIDKVTKSEASAINDAFFKAITDSADAVKKYAGTNVSKVAPLWNGPTGTAGTFLQTLSKAMQVADVYGEVVDLGETYKAQYSFGVKVYDDEKVNAAVKKAEELVYADLAPAEKLEKAATYLQLAAAALDYDDLYAVNYEYEKFRAAIADAKAKFYTNGAPTPKVTYGSDKTPEEDLVYLLSTYASSEKSDWEDIADEAIDALNNAESYADIEAALAAAKEDLSGLMLAADATAVANAKAKYAGTSATYVAGGATGSGALDEYVDEVKKIKGTTDYSALAYSEAVEAGKKLINDAKTVSAVEAAYAEAKALIDGIKTKDELTVAKNAVIEQIKALPLYANLTSADKTTVIAAYDAYKAYVETPGAAVTDITNKVILENDLTKVLGLQSDDINERIDALEKELAKLNPNSDADAEKYAAKRAEIQALVDEADTFNSEVKAIKKVEGLTTLKVTNADNTALAALLDSEATVWKAELHVVAALAVKASKTNATAADIKAALDAYNNLTDRQKYKLDADVVELIKIIQKKAVETVESLKITAGSTAAKGSITVKWTVKGDTTYVEGYQIFRSLKKNSGFGTKPFFTTTKQSYKNTKALKKGTRYYYKVRAFVEIDNVKYYSDWSNKAYRIAK